MAPESSLAPSAVYWYALGQQRLGRPLDLLIKLASSKRLPKRLLPRKDQLIGLVFGIERDGPWSSNLACSSLLSVDRL